jgi:hypothetical protein
MLENSPFEPLEQISLKELTFKTVFLTAITTFRRCSDLQALRIDEHLMRIQEQGITFIRHGLAKQDREKHFGAKIFVGGRELKTPLISLMIWGCWPIGKLSTVGKTVESIER